jgi:uncharacterized membrane protein
MPPSELLDLLVRWVHLIAGIMWIGNSMLFNWLDRNLVKREGEARPGVDGVIWMVHSGAFYEVEKKLLEPNQLPDQLHWFKWQNGVTWMSGIGLLVLVYYMNEGAFLTDPAVSALGRWQATGLCVGALVGGWVVYDLLWRGLGRAPIVATALSFAFLFGVAYVFAHTISGRAAYMHVGVLMGTLMTGNVWMIILPSQKELISATREGREQDRALSLRAKQRSVHNNYMTFPLLFIMISSHFPNTWGGEQRWAVLIILLVGGAVVRHLMNVRFWFRPWLGLLLPTVACTILGVFFLTAKKRVAGADGQTVAFSLARDIVTQRCQSCHSKTPTEKMFPTAPAGVLFDTPEQIRAMSARIRERTVTSKTMPFLNKTAMTDAERVTLGRWIDQGAKTE